MTTKKALFILIFIMISTRAFCDGFIVVPDRSSAHIRPHFPLEVKYHHVKVDIDEQYAQTTIEQVFYNPSSGNLEGQYIFPVPKGAYIKKFTIFINGIEVEAKMLPKEKARKIYEDIVRRQKDPALLEYYDLNIFNARIFPIEPFSEKRVKISYSEVLRKNNGTISYTYPLNTEKFSSKKLKSLKINVSVKSKGSIQNLYSTTHGVKTVRRNLNHSDVSYSETNSRPDRDFKLFYSTSTSKIGLSLLTYKERYDEGFFFIDITPDLHLAENRIAKKNLIFVLDVSGSMAGKKLDQAKKALTYCINNLNTGDRFDVVAFSTESDSLFGELREGDAKNISIALDYIKNLRAVGGTNIEEALSKSFKSLNEKGSVIFITDGKPTIGKTSESDILKLVEERVKNRARIFTFGIGEGINIRLLDKMTSLTGGFRSYVGDDEDIEVQVSDFFTKISYPVLTDLKIRSVGVKLHKIYPDKIDDLFKGSSVTLIGRYKKGGESLIELSGKIDGKRKKIFFRRFFDEVHHNNYFIASLWAARRVGYLLDQIRLNGESEELKDEIVRIAGKYGIITPYTSYLIVEDEETALRDRRIKAREQVVGRMLPEFRSYRKRIKEEYSNLKKSFGSDSIRASKEIQNLNQSRNLYETFQGKKRLEYRDKHGSDRSVTDDIKLVKGRAFYLNGKIWMDSLVKKRKIKEIIRIKFNSMEYYRLIRKNSGFSKYLSLGNNLKFVEDMTLYEIFE